MLVGSTAGSIYLKNERVLNVLKIKQELTTIQCTMHTEVSKLRMSARVEEPVAM